jgi:hypothetical protein
VRATTATFAAFARGSIYAAVYLLIVVAAAFLMADWHVTDARVLANLLASVPQLPLEPDVVPVDLDAAAGSLRPPLIALLQGIDTRARAGGTRPRAIAFDIAFTKDGGSPAQLPPLETALRDLGREGVELYGAFHFDPNGTGRYDPGFLDLHEAGIYQYLTAGHSELHDIVGLPLVTYTPVLRPTDDSAYKALPLLVTQGRAAGALAPADERPVIIRVGSHDDFMRVASRGVRGTLQDQASLAGAIVVVGNIKTELVHYDDRSGFELLTWAIDDLEAARLETAYARPFLDTGLMLILAAVLSGAAFGAFAFVFGRLRGRRTALPLALLGSLGLPLGLLALVESQLVAHGLLFAQVSLPIIASVAAAAVSTWWARDAIRRDRLLAELRGARSADVTRYDVFISYARDEKNTRWVEENVLAPLYAARRPDGKPLAVFFDRHAIKVGYAWYATIVDAICESKFFIPIYSHDYFSRPFCVDELNVAMVRRVDNPAFRILPIAHATGPVPARYASVQYVEAEREAAFMDHILATILHDGAEAETAHA